MPSFQGMYHVLSLGLIFQEILISSFCIFIKYSEKSKNLSGITQLPENLVGSKERETAPKKLVVKYNIL